MVRGKIVNEFNEQVGKYNINGVNEYSVTMYNVFIGFMTKIQLVNYILKLNLFYEETKVI